MSFLAESLWTLVFGFCDALEVSVSLVNKQLRRLFLAAFSRQSAFLLSALALYKHKLPLYKPVALSVNSVLTALSALLPASFCMKQIVCALRELKSEPRSREWSVDLCMWFRNYEVYREKRFSHHGETPFPTKPFRRVIFYASAEDIARITEAKSLGLRVITTEDLKALNKNRKKIRSLNRSFDAALVTANIVRSLPRLIGPSLGKMGKFPHVVAASEPLSAAYTSLLHHLTLHFVKRPILRAVIGQTDTPLHALVINTLCALFALKGHFKSRQIGGVFVKHSMGKPHSMFQAEKEQKTRELVPFRSIRRHMKKPKGEAKQVNTDELSLLTKQQRSERRRADAKAERTLSQNRKCVLCDRFPMVSDGLIQSLPSCPTAILSDSSCGSSCNQNSESEIVIVPYCFDDFFTVWGSRLARAVCQKSGTDSIASKNIYSSLCEEDKST